jgi:hypothetical protein
VRPKPIPPPLFRDCEAEDCPAQIDEHCELCDDESLDETISIDEEIIDEEEST